MGKERHGFTGLLYKSKAAHAVIDVLLTTLMWDYSKLVSDLSVPPERTNVVLEVI